MSLEFLPRESLSLLDEGLGDILLELAPEPWKNFTIMRDRLGLACRHTRTALGRAFEEAKRADERRFSELLRSIGYPGSTATETAGAATSTEHAAGSGAAGTGIRPIEE